MEPYEIVCLQHATQVVVEADPTRRDTIIHRNVTRLLELVDWSVYQTNGRVRLIVAGEYSLTGTHRPRSIEEWLRIALPIPNVFTERIGQKAREHNLYIAAQLMEADPDWPGRFFDTAFIIGPQGDLLLRYRKHNGPNNLNVQYTAPGDVLTEYVKRYGEDALFPVADTPIGRLGCLICYDLNFPEVARCLTLKGAEVLLHLTAETTMITDQWDKLKVARAYENRVYLASADNGPWLESRWPAFFNAGRSMILDFQGRVLAESRGPGERIIGATVDIEALRRLRSQAQPHELNPFCQLRAGLYGRIYQAAEAWPDDAFADRPMADLEEARALARHVLRGWQDRGVLPPPGGGGGGTPSAYLR